MLRVKLGTTYLASGDRERAAAEFEKALELSPGLVSEIMGRALRSEGGQ
jgi:Tfp pilus assembly protein PilF